MAFYVRLDKVRETPSVACYRYSADQRQFGEAEVDKLSGDVRIVRSVDGTGGANVSARAAAKLRTEWRRGSLPQTAEWAS